MGDEAGGWTWPAPQAARAMSQIWEMISGVEPTAQSESTCFHQDQETDMEGVMRTLALQPFPAFKDLFCIESHLPSGAKGTLVTLEWQH